MCVSCGSGHCDTHSDGNTIVKLPDMTDYFDELYDYLTFCLKSSKVRQKLYKVVKVILLQTLFDVRI